MVNKIRLFLMVGLMISVGAQAATKAKPMIPSMISIEAETGMVLYESNADIVRPPASMIKLMQMLLVSEGLREGKWTLEQEITASRNAQRMGGTQVYLEAGDVYTLGHLMKAVAVASANDATMAVAEGLWGSEEAYKEAMNKRAQELGMKQSVFHSVHGLPPDWGKPYDATTARDMALLAQACVKEPQVLEWTNLRELQFREGGPKKYTTNKLLRKRDDMDGLKTGFINKAGFCVTSTLEKNGVRIIAVLMGFEDKRLRFNEAERLLDEGVASLKRGQLVAKGIEKAPVVTVQNCETPTLQLEIDSDIELMVRSNEWDKIELIWDHPKSLTAPIKKGQKVGTVTAVLGGQVLAESELLASAEMAEAGWAWKLEQSVLEFFE